MKDKTGRIQANDCVVSASFDAQLGVTKNVFSLSFQNVIYCSIFTWSITPQSDAQSVNRIHVRVKCC